MKQNLPEAHDRPTELPRTDLRLPFVIVAAEGLILLLVYALLVHYGAPRLVMTGIAFAVFYGLSALILLGHCAVIGGGLVGTETAEYLLEKGCTVSIIEMMDKIANGESSTILPTILADFASHNVQQYVNTKVSAIEEGCVKATRGEEELSIPCDMVVMAVGSRKNVLDVEGVTVPVYYAGDCSGERTAGIMEAVRSGYKAANEI